MRLEAAVRGKPSACLCTSQTLDKLHARAFIFSTTKSLPMQPAGSVSANWNKSALCWLAVKITNCELMYVQWIFFLNVYISEVFRDFWTGLFLRLEYLSYHKLSVVFFCNISLRWSFLNLCTVNLWALHCATLSLLRITSKDVSKPELNVFHHSVCVCVFVHQRMRQTSRNCSSSFQLFKNSAYIERLVCDARSTVG